MVWGEEMTIGNRIMIIGSPGSGKSTFSRRLAEITSIPLIHLDRTYWNAGWIETPKEQFYAWQRKIVQGDTWIIDGNYGSSMDIRLSKADTVINFELSRWTCIMGYFKRLITNVGQSRPDMGEGCPERLDLEFIKYIWKFPKNIAGKNRDRIGQCERLNVITFKNRKEANSFLEKISQSFRD